MTSTPTTRAAPSGAVVIDKERGPSSNRVVQRIKRALGGVKTGHAGTLDPEAEGVLLVCVGRGTRLVPFLAVLGKEYEARVVFGAETDTQDAAGETVRTAPAEHLSAGLLRREAARFLGETFQVPPMFSAVKVGGERLYRKARRGEVVERPPRPIVVSAFDLVDWSPPEALLRIRCGSGTYVRTLCRDLGRACDSAAHLGALVRTAVGPFRRAEALTAGAVEERQRRGETGFVVPPAAMLAHLPLLPLGSNDAEGVRHGRAPLAAAPPPGCAPGSLLRLVDGSGRLLAVARLVREGLPLKLERVL